MGKSGHVARKIAATLASTGTPALFVHPAEASHGDLGMIVAGRRGPGAVQLRRDRRTCRPGGAYAPLRPAAGGDHRARRFDAGRRRRRRAAACRSPPKPARWAWRRPPPPPCRWRSATRSPSRCSPAAASPPPISASFHPGGTPRHAPAPRARPDASGRRDAAGAAGHADGPRPAADDREAFRLSRRRRRVLAGWSASSPTATCAAPWAPTCCPASSARS